jgi:glycosyltransferase involved in cell wall biosynthesis
MKILFLADVFFPDTIGGAGTVAYHLSLELTRKGHEVHILTRNADGKFPDHEQYNPSLFIHRFLIPQKASMYLILSEVNNSLSSVRKLYNEIEFDIGCVHQSMVAIGPSFSARFKNTPFVYYYHSPWHEEYLVKKGEAGGGRKGRDRLIAYLMHWIERRILLKASNVIVLSRYMRDNVLKLYDYPSDKIKIIPGGVSLDHFRLPNKNRIDVKHSINYPIDKTIFLTVRNLVPRMGLETLIETFNRSKTLRKNSILLLGGRGNLEHRLKSMVDKLGLRDTVHFLDHIPDEDLPGIYQAADYFVLPTEKLEGFGLVILEAMACGTPVLGTPVGAIPEIIGQFDKRLIFKGTNWEDIKEKMEDIIERPDLYYFDPKACRKFVQENYSWKKAASDFEEVAIRLMT